MQNEWIEYEGYYLPFVNELLAHLAAIRELVFVIDGSEVGHECITLMISLIYRKRALPITWLVVKGCKGHLPERVHLDLLPNCRQSCPKTVTWCFWEMENLTGSNFRRPCKPKGGAMCVAQPRILSSTKKDRRFSFEDLFLQVDDQICIPQVWFTKEGYGPVTVIAQVGTGVCSSRLSGDQFRIAR